MRVRKLMKTHIEEQDTKAKTADALDLSEDGRLKRENAAKFLDISVDMLDDYIRKGLLPKANIGRTVGVPKKALMLLMAGRMQIQPGLVVLEGGAQTQPRKRKSA